VGNAAPTFDDLFGACERSAIHLEMRDGYMLDDPVYIDWQAGQAIDPVASWREWFELIQRTVGRGVEIRRARIVSEPVSQYIRYEYDVTQAHNIAAGEDVRWLPRRQASDIALPGNDFWLFDKRLVQFSHFSGDGDFVADEQVDDSAVIRLCSAAFEAVWQRAIPHQNYRVT
jgi:hypothetical protein